MGDDPYHRFGGGAQDSCTCPVYMFKGTNFLLMRNLKMILLTGKISLAINFDRSQSVTPEVELSDFKLGIVFSVSNAFSG